LAALSGIEPKEPSSSSNNYWSLEARIVKARQSPKPKVRLGMNKPVVGLYAEVLRLRRIIAELQSAKPTRDDRKNPK